MVIEAQSRDLTVAHSYVTTRPPLQLLQQQREAFLIEYRKCGNVSRSCQAAGTNRPNIYRTIELDPDFKLAFKDAQEDAIDALEEAARIRAVDGVSQERGIYYKGDRVDSFRITEYSDSLLTLLLRANRPERFKDRISVDSTSLIKIYSGFDISDV